jgi:methyl coenzyme M reductase alpha subunit
MRNSPNDFPGFSEIEGDVLDKAMQLNLSLQDAYWLVAGPKRIQQAAREAEHRTINQRQKLAGKDRVQGDSSSEIGVSSPKIPQDVVAMAKKVNMDPEEYYALMNADNIDDWREFKAKKNKGR